MINVVHTIAEARAELDAVRHAGGTVGLVPTMGFLHDGHKSLMARSVADNTATLVTIFVNPLQFAPDEDLEAYPRSIDADVALCESAGVAVVLVPSVDEMYPLQPVVTTVTVDGVSAPLEGESRPTHFAGVATVVSKLFNIGGVCRAYFGEKDWQQLAVIRRMAVDLSFPVEVVGCSIIREANGLAMSSRNVYLTDAEREAAGVLNRALQSGIDAIDGGESDAAAIQALVREIIAAEPLVADPDYVAVVDAASLQSINPLVGEVRLLLAAQVGKARLIDNMGITIDRRER